MDSFPAFPDEPSKQIQQTSGSSVDSLVGPVEVVIVPTLSLAGGDEGVAAASAEAARDATQLSTRPGTGMFVVSLSLFAGSCAQRYGHGGIYCVNSEKFESVQSRRTSIAD